MESPKKKGVYKLFRDLKICLHLQKTFVSRTNNVGYKQVPGRSAYTIKRRWYRLQRRGFINYLERHRSAYTTKRLSFRLQTMVVINKSLVDLPTPPIDLRFRLQTMVVINKSLVDLHTPLKDYGIAYKEGGL